MGEQLTPQQAMAVQNRGGKLLVSAAAGSGKTKVLVDRLMRYLTDPTDPANLDDFLIITYTKAAAAELRGKIAAKLSERIAQSPENRHLQHQMQRLYLAKISTVHSFCADLLREYAYRLDIAPDFRVGDENECRELRDMAMNRVLDEAYAQTTENVAFCTFVNTQGLGRDDRLVPQIVEKVYDSARCHMDSDGWLETCLQHADVSGIQDAGQTLWGKYLIKDLYDGLQLQIESLQACATQSARVPAFEKVTALLNDTIFQLQQLQQCNGWNSIVAHRNVVFGRLTFPRKHDEPELAERIKAVRSRCKASVEKILRPFTDPTAQIMADMEQTGEATRGLIALVRAFSAEYDRNKRRRRLLDFGDLEHRTLDLLLGGTRSGPTRVAREVGRRFREVLVDEYQDSNAVQDRIFSVLTEERQNCFMVGDVKQSIYQFRLADPGIFLEKYGNYSSAETASAGQGRKVQLSSNFRSGGAVLAAVNDVFRQCMSPKVGGLVYGDEEALREGMPHRPLGEPEVEFHAIAVQEDTYGEEAAYVAERIRTLLDGSHMIRQGEGMRPIRPDDIVILLRSPGSVGQDFATALEQRRIRVTTGGGQDLLQTAEVMTLRSLLQTIANPRQDIPLLSTLASPIFGFTADELAQIRGQTPTGSIYDALMQSTMEKTADFLRVLRRLRAAAGMDTLAQLLEEIFVGTHLDGLYAAMPDGAHRSENLRSFFQLAVDFETSGRRDLNQFLEYLERMEEKGLIVAGQQTAVGCVTIMSIHRSKGLEFPVVFLCGLGRRFNREDLKAQVLCDKTLGLGLSVMDETNRVRYPTIAKRAIAVKAGRESLSEELRVLYVAMTRARDRLIMTYADQRLEAELDSLSMVMDICPSELLTQEVSCPGEWILQAAWHRTEAGALFAGRNAPIQTQVSDTPWLITVGVAPDWHAREGTQTVEGKQGLKSDAIADLADSLRFVYPDLGATRMPSKRTATQLKGREKDEEAAENAQGTERLARAWRKPTFAGADGQGKAYGTLIHSVMAAIRYEYCVSSENVEDELHRLVKNGYLTEAQVKNIDSGKILRFFETELGKKLRQSPECVWREFKFSILDCAERYGDCLPDEQVLLQGVVDCALVEEDGVTIIDFKTDRVSLENAEQLAVRYGGQVDTYALAMSRIFEKPVKGKYLYLFHLERFVEIA